jgi:hypothetical protein
VRRVIQNYVLFTRQLNKALKAQDPNARLHLVLSYQKDLERGLQQTSQNTDNAEPARLFTKNEMDELASSVDLLLFVPNLAGATTVQAMKQYDTYFADYGYGEVAKIESKLVFMLDTDDAAFANELDDIRSNRFGGVGGWMLHKQIETLIGMKFTDAVLLQNRDYVDRLDSDIRPGPLCKLICPNRGILIGLVILLLALYMGAYLLSLFSPVVATLAKKYLLYVVGGAFLILAVIVALLLCVPSWTEWRKTEVIVLIMVLLGGYAAKTSIDKRRQANYP